MEFSRKMCIEVILEVIRYLEKCHSSLNIWRHNLKDVINIDDILINDELITKNCKQQVKNAFNSSSSYSEFKDFTWYL